MPRPRSRPERPAECFGLIESFFRWASCSRLRGLPRVLARPDRLPDADPGTRRVVIVRSSPFDATVWIVVRNASALPVAFELEPNFLWQDTEDLPFLTDGCVFDAKAAPLHCSRALPESAFLAIRSQLTLQPKGELEWMENGARYLGELRRGIPARPLRHGLLDGGRGAARSARARAG